MEWALNIFVFLASCGLLYFAGELIVVSLLKLARYFGVTEFIVAFFVMAFAASLPNLIVGVTSAFEGVPELSFGDIMGNNMIAMTLAVAVAVFFSKDKEIPAKGKTIQSTAIFTIISAILPIILISDGILSRIDGIILISFFFYYVFWIFSKRERFEKVYEEHKFEILKEIKQFFVDLAKVIFGILILILSANGIVESSAFIATELGLPLVFVGIMIIGFGSALPEVYFAITSAKKDETSLILGNLMGAVIIPATLILGIISIIQPIRSEGFDFFAISRIFLVLSAFVFWYSAKTNEKITKKESYILLTLYILFIITVLVFNKY